MISDKAVEAAARALDPLIWEMNLPGHTRSEVEDFHHRRQKSIRSARAALLAALPHLNEPGDPATIKRLLDDMDAENMPNERRAEILAIRIRRATPEEAATVPAFEESGHGG